MKIPAVSGFSCDVSTVGSIHVNLKVGEASLSLVYKFSSAESLNGDKHG